ncbi:MAG: DUF952 domain-containing protein, partial [Myxococcota bacterium]
CLDEFAAQVRALDDALCVRPLGTSFIEGALGCGVVDFMVVASYPLLSMCASRLGLSAPALLDEGHVGSYGRVRLASGVEVTVRLIVEGSPLEQNLTAQQAGLGDPVQRERYAVALRHGAGAGAAAYATTKAAFWQSWKAPGPLWREAREPVLKVLTEPQWRALCERHETSGAPIDERDGYIHLSTPSQVHETVARHFAGQSSLWLLTLDAQVLGPSLRFEPSRGGALFPHLYAPLRLGEVALARPYVEHSPATHEG